MVTFIRFHVCTKIGKKDKLLVAKWDSIKKHASKKKFFKDIHFSIETLEQDGYCTNQNNFTKVSHSTMHSPNCGLWMMTIGIWLSTKFFK
jgi:hypothetical protein